MVKLVRNEEGAAPCRHCLKHSKKEVYPVVVTLDGMYYARCPKCNEFDKYEFLALSRKKAINVWNITMEGKGS